MCSSFRPFSQLPFLYPSPYHGSRCDLCPHSFRLKGDLSKHKKNVHLGERNHVCPQCFDRFTEKGNLNKHKKRYHSNVKEYKCSQPGCRAEFATSDGLTRHYRQMHQKRR